MLPLATILLDELRWDGPERVVFAAAYPPPPAGLAYDGERVQNIYPYDRKGRLLHDVRLFDESGRPLDVLRGGFNPNRATVKARSGPLCSTHSRFATSTRAPAASRTRTPSLSVSSRRR